METINNKEVIIIAGGGTGGHLYPAIAIARSMLQQNHELEIHFIGTPTGLETKIIPKEGFPLHLIKVGKLNHKNGYFEKMMTLLRLPWALIKSFVLLIQLKPSLVLGVGGYASGPFVLSAAVLGFRTAIWEPNAYPGLTNRILARFVDNVYAVFKDAIRFFNKKVAKKIRLSGLPIRQEFEDFSRQFINSDVEKADGIFRVLVFGGSQGARAINNIVLQACTQNTDWLNGIELIHQTGSIDYQRISQEYLKPSLVTLETSQIQCKEYLFEMEKYYSWADLVICRAGASTVAEIAACEKPAILIPLPSAADNHQQKNAESLVSENAGVMILQKDLTAETFIKKILELKNNPIILKNMRENIKKFHQPFAAQKLAKELLKEEN